MDQCAEQQSLRTICRALARKASREVNQQKLEKTVDGFGEYLSWNPIPPNPPPKKSKDSG